MRSASLALLVLFACERGDTSQWRGWGSGSPTSPPVTASVPPAAPPQRPATAPGVEKKNTLRKGDKVSAQWSNGRWYPGTLTAVYSDGTADVRYDDGDRSRGLPFAKIRLVKRPMLEVEVEVADAPAARAPTTKKKGLVEGASCAGPGWQYVCGGRCTDVKSDTANCGSCGHRCDDGYTCDGSGTCRDASGRL